MAESLVLPGSSHLLSHLWPLGSLYLELCLLGCQHPRLASPVCLEPPQAHVLDLWFLTGSLRALFFPSPSPACGVSGLWPDPARHASAWTRTCEWGSCLPRNKGPWPRLITVRRANGEVGWPPPFPPVVLLTPAGHPQTPSGLPSLHRHPSTGCWCSNASGDRGLTISGSSLLQAEKFLSPRKVI